MVITQSRLLAGTALNMRCTARAGKKGRVFPRTAGGTPRTVKTERGIADMKKLAILLALLMTFSMIPNAFAGENNRVSADWYYNDPDRSAYLDGKWVPDFTNSYYEKPSSTAARGRLPIDSYALTGLGSRTLKRTYPSMRGSDVRTLQSVLTALGYSCGPIDGIFGDKTRAAVKSFQRNNGLKADGIVGPNTKTRLRLKYAGIR